MTYLELTVGVEEEVSRLEISVDHVGGMHVLETGEDLIDKELDVIVGEFVL